MTYVLGIDGGNSKTFALVADLDGRICGYGQSGGSNHQAVGLHAALESINEAAQQAIDAAHVQPDQIAVLSAGLAGADLPEDFAILGPALQQLKLGRHVDLRNDTQAALRAGTHEPWGVVVICGSGFNAAGRAPDGREIVLPGLGWVSGDWGGGAELAREAIRLVMRADDGRGEPTLLTAMVIDALRQPSPYELMRAIYHKQISQHDILHLAPLVFRAANRGDVPAQDLIVRLGKEVGINAVALIRRLQLQDLPVHVVLGGSVFKGEGPFLIETAREVIHQTAPAAVLVRPPFEPVVGAVLLGLEAAGVTADDQIYDRLHSTMPATLRIRHSENA